MKVADRTYIISGGASGLARETAKLLHSEGAYVSLLDLNTDNGEEAVKEFGSERAKFFETDVTDTDSIKAAIEGTVAWIKETGKEIGGVIAGAGVGNPQLIVNKKNEPLALSSFDFVTNINLRGTVDLIRQSLPHMTKNTPLGPDGERGVVIMVSSAAAYDGQMGQVSYAASKGAVRSMTLPMARDLSQFGIRVITLAPSMFDSSMTRMLNEKTRQSLTRTMEFPKRPGEAPEFARMARDCIENIYLNGVTIRLDGAARMPARL